MVESKQDKILNTKFIPIMNKVRNDLQNKLADELRSNSNSFAGLMAAAAGPDGGMASMQAQNDTLKYTGKWTSKTTGRLYCDGQERVEATAYHGQCFHGTEDDRQDDKGQNTEIIHRLHHAKGCHQHHLLSTAGSRKIAIGAQDRLGG